MLSLTDLATFWSGRCPITKCKDWHWITRALGFKPHDLQLLRWKRGFFVGVSFLTPFFFPVLFFTQFSCSGVSSH